MFLVFYVVERAMVELAMAWRGKTRHGKDLLMQLHGPARLGTARQCTVWCGLVR